MREEISEEEKRLQSAPAVLDVVRRAARADDREGQVLAERAPAHVHVREQPAVVLGVVLAAADDCVLHCVELHVDSEEIAFLGPAVVFDPEVIAEPLGALLAAVGDGLVGLGHALGGLGLFRVHVSEANDGLLPFLCGKEKGEKVFLGRACEATTVVLLTSVGSLYLWVPGTPVSRATNPPLGRGHQPSGFRSTF